MDKSLTPDQLNSIKETSFDALRGKFCSSRKGYYVDNFMGEFLPLTHQFPISENEELINGTGVNSDQYTYSSTMKDRYVNAALSRSSPVMNRGYYVRVKSVETFLEYFLSCNSCTNEKKRKNVILLGAGFDTLYFRSREKYQQIGIQGNDFRSNVNFPASKQQKHKRSLVSNLQTQRIEEENEGDYEEEGQYIANANANIAIKKDTLLGEKAREIFTNNIEMRVDEVGKQVRNTSLDDTLTKTTPASSDERTESKDPIVNWFEIDYKDMIQRKVQMLEVNPLFQSTLDNEKASHLPLLKEGEMSPEGLDSSAIQNMPLLCSFAKSRYHLLGLDLCEKNVLSSSFTKLSSMKAISNQFSVTDTTIDFHLDDPTFIVLECLLMYMNDDIATSILIQLSTLFPNAMILSYDAMIQSPCSQFGKMMRYNLGEQRGLHVPGITNYPSIDSHLSRLIECGWQKGNAADMFAIYEDLMNEHLSKEERIRIHGIEMLDEVEELRLLMQHYILVIGRQGKCCIPLDLTPPSIVKGKLLKESDRFPFSVMLNHERQG